MRNTDFEDIILILMNIKEVSGKMSRYLKQYIYITENKQGFLLRFKKVFVHQQQITMAP